MKNKNNNVKKIFSVGERERRDTVDCKKPQYYISLLDTTRVIEFSHFLAAAEHCSDSAFDYLERFNQAPFAFQEILERKFSRQCPQIEELSHFVREQLAHCGSNTTPAPALSSSTSHHNSSTEKGIFETNLIPSNYTELYVATGHGFGNGVLNALSQQLSAYLINKGYSNSRIKAFSLSIITAIIHSAYAASLPILFASLPNTHAEDDEQTNKILETLLQQVIPIFSTNMALSVGFQLVDYLQANCLVHAPILQNLVRSIPTVSTAWAVVSNPIGTATNLATSVVSSAATFTLFSYFSKPAAIEEKIDMKNASDTRVYPNTTKHQDKLLDLIPQPKTYQYITPAELKTIREGTSNFLNKLTEFKHLLEASISKDRTKVTETNVRSELETYQKNIADKSNILSTVQNVLTDADILRDMLEDNIHQKACENLTDKHEYVAAMEKLGNVFKFMQNKCREMHNKLNTVVGFVQASRSFDENIQFRLDEIISTINSPLSKAGIYLSKYSIADTAEKAKKQGAKEALQKFFANNIIEHPHKMSSFSTAPRRPYSEITDYTIHTLGSDESSSSSLNSEGDSTTSQQKQLLLKP